MAILEHGYFNLYPQSPEDQRYNWHKPALKLPDLLKRKNVTGQGVKIAMVNSGGPVAMRYKRTTVEGTLTNWIPPAPGFPVRPDNTSPLAGNLDLDVDGTAVTVTFTTEDSMVARAATIQAQLDIDVPGALCLVHTLNPTVEASYGDPSPPIDPGEATTLGQSRWIMIISPLPGDQGSITVKNSSTADVLDALGLEAAKAADYTISERTEVGNWPLAEPCVMRYDVMDFIPHPDMSGADIDWSLAKSFWTQENVYFPHGDFNDVGLMASFRDEGETSIAGDREFFFESTHDPDAAKSLAAVAPLEGGQLSIPAHSFVANIVSVNRPTPAQDNRAASLIIDQDWPAGLASQTGLVYELFLDDPNAVVYDHNGDGGKSTSMLVGKGAGICKGATVIPIHCNELPGQAGTAKTAILQYLIDNNVKVTAWISSAFGNLGFVPPDTDPSVDSLIAKAEEAVCKGMLIFSIMGNFGTDIDNVIPPPLISLLSSVKRVEGCSSTGPFGFDPLALKGDDKWDKWKWKHDWDKDVDADLNRFALYSSYNEDLTTLAGPGGFINFFDPNPRGAWPDMLNISGSTRRGFMMSQKTAADLKAGLGDGPAASHGWMAATVGTGPTAVNLAGIAALALEAYGDYDLGKEGEAHGDLVRALIRTTARDLVGDDVVPGPDPFYGRGVPDAKEAVLSVFKVRQ